MKLNSKALRVASPTEKERKTLTKNPIYLILDNVLDTYNVGAIFRLADAVSASKILLCGGTETPPNHRIKKSSINTTEWIDWEYFASTSEAIADLKNQIANIQIIAIEQNSKSVAYDKIDYTFPLALVVGHETDGISQEVLDLCDKIAELPMWGVNVSLNVMVSLGIVLYKAMESISSK